MKKDVERALRRLARLPVQERRGRPAGPRPSKADLVRLYVKGGLSLRETADKLGMKKDRVRRALLAYGLERRPHVTPKLQRADLAAILTERQPPDAWKHERRPWREIASKYGVSVKTLERFIKSASARGVTPRTLKGQTRKAWDQRKTWRI